jgi:hypothetical protein
MPFAAHPHENHVFGPWGTEFGKWCPKPEKSRILGFFGVLVRTLFFGVFWTFSGPMKKDH